MNYSGLGLMEDYGNPTFESVVLVGSFAAEVLIGCVHP